MGEMGDTVETTEQANAEALKRLLAAEPVLTDVCFAGDVIAGLGERVMLHAGPPIEWQRMCSPLQSAVIGAAVFEGWADGPEEARDMAANGAIALHPNHDFGAVGPMTGITTRSMAVLVVENRAFGNRAFCTLNEGAGNVMRFGGGDAEVRERLTWMAATLAPALAAALDDRGGLALKGMVARALSMGDEMHMRNVAGTSLFLREMLPALARTAGDGGTLASILEFIGANDQFFLNIVMAMAKAIADPAHGIEGSSVVTAMCRNGTEFGVRVSGTGDEWFTAPAAMVDGLFFPGFSGADANPDIGDSCIVECVGLGGFAMATAPAVAGFVGAGSAADAATYTRDMEAITVGSSPDWTLPALDFAGVPTGIDVRQVVESATPPAINTAIVHQAPGKGMIGAGVSRAPMACFEDAAKALVIA
jgi:hypothetical protein